MDYFWNQKPKRNKHFSDTFGGCWVPWLCIHYKFTRFTQCSQFELKINFLIQPECSPFLYIPLNIHFHFCGVNYIAINVSLIMFSNWQQPALIHMWVSDVNCEITEDIFCWITTLKITCNNTLPSKPGTNIFKCNAAQKHTFAKLFEADNFSVQLICIFISKSTARCLYHCMFFAWSCCSYLFSVFWMHK